MTELETESLRREGKTQLGSIPGLEQDEVFSALTDLHCQTHLFCKGLPISAGGSEHPIPG